MDGPRDPDDTLEARGDGGGAAAAEEPLDGGAAGPGADPPWWKRWLAALAASGVLDPAEWPLRKLLRRALVLVAVVLALGVARQSIVHVRETEAAVVVHNLSGRMELRDRAGFHLLLPYLARCYKLDKTIQRLDLTWRAPEGGAGAGRDVKLKTADGSNVSLDVSVSYKLIPDHAVEVLRQTGRGMRLAPGWVESAARQVCFSTFGELTTEQMYDAEQRNGKARVALEEMNRRLGRHGLEVIALVAGEFRFHQEYEKVIQEKKLADQQVEERQSQARALLEDQQRRVIEADNAAAVRVAAAEAQAANRLIDAAAAAEKTKRQADGYHAARLRQADTELHRLKNEATGVRATRLSEAAGLEARRVALAGDGGLNMVGLEYARRLGSVRFSGTPILRDPALRQFAVQPGEHAGTDAETIPQAAGSAAPLIDSFGPPSAGPRPPPAPPPPPPAGDAEGEGGGR